MEPGKSLRVCAAWKMATYLCNEFRERFARIKPDVFSLAHLVEVQVAFVAVRTGRAEYAFVPRLRSLCLLSKAVERVSPPFL